jgi:hypothetical protein
VAYLGILWGEEQVASNPRKDAGKENQIGGGCGIYESLAGAREGGLWWDRHDLVDDGSSG